MLLPRWFFFNIYAMSAWRRTIVVPLAVVDAYKPVTRLPESMHIRELFLAAARDAALAREADASVVLVDELLPRRRLDAARRSSGCG